MLSRGLTADIKSLSQRCKCKPNVLYKTVASYGTRDVEARGFTNTFIISLAWRLPLSLFHNTNTCRSGHLQFFLFLSTLLKHLLSENKLCFLLSNLWRMTEERDAELLARPWPQSWPACSYFLWALALSANHFHGWFKEHVPNLELLTQGREQATWQMPWALTDSTNLKPRPSSPQVVLRFINLLAMLG